MTARLGLDHLVYAVPNLENAIEEFERRLGVSPALGGRHEGLGTHNAILPLTGESYVELMAADPNAQAPNQARPFGLDTLDSPRLVTWAVRSRDIQMDVEAARERGFDPGIVLEMTRKVPGGETLAWKLSLRTTPFGSGLVPFVIDWGNTNHPSCSSGGNSVRCALSSFVALHPDPEPVRQALTALGAEISIEAFSCGSL